MTAREMAIMRSTSRFLLKYTPYAVALTYTLFCLLRALGAENYMVASFMAYAGVLWMPFHFASSYAMGFCVWHRRLIWYHGATGLMVFLQMWFGFGGLRRYLNAGFCLWGLLICGIVTYKISRREFGCTKGQ